jgi:hypothetical protein
VLTPMELLEQWDAYTIHSVSTQTTEIVRLFQL